MILRKIGYIFISTITILLLSGLGCYFYSYVKVKSVMNSDFAAVNINIIKNPNGNPDLTLKLKAPDEKIKVKLVTRWGLFNFIESSGVYKTEGETLKLSNAPALQGTYKNNYGGGLFWSRKVVKFKLSNIYEFISLKKGTLYIAVYSKHDELLYMSRLKLPSLSSHSTIKKLFFVDGVGYNYIVPKHLNKKSDIVVMISGSGNNEMFWEGDHYASVGMPVLLLKPVPHMSKSCVGNLDSERLYAATEKFIDALDIESERIHYVGISAGATALMLPQENIVLPDSFKYALSPSTLHFNGGAGLGCVKPSSYWKNKGAYQKFYGDGIAGLIRLVKVNIGLISQREAIELTLNSMSKNEIKEITLISDIPEKVTVYWGSDDHLIPTEYMYQSLCGEESIEKCQLMPNAGHDLVYDSVLSKCKQYKNSYRVNCTASFAAQKKIFNHVLSNRLN